jgi:hypothetical protein
MAGTTAIGTISETMIGVGAEIIIAGGEMKIPGIENTASMFACISPGNFDY